MNDRTVRDAVERGARTIEQVASVCGAGTRCGGCWPALARLVDELQPRPDAVRTSAA